MPSCVLSEVYEIILHYPSKIVHQTVPLSAQIFCSILFLILTEPIALTQGGKTSDFNQSLVLIRWLDRSIVLVGTMTFPR